MVIASLGEILFRISPNNNNPFVNEDLNNFYVGGAEYNVISYLSQFGYDTRFYSVVPSNKLGTKVLQKANSYNINTDYIKKDNTKMGMYFALDVNEVKPQEVLYDRKYSAFYEYDFDMKEIEKFLDNVDILHLSGITPALSKRHQDLILHTLKLAKNKNIKVSYDSNFRAKLWSSQEAGHFLKKCLPYISYAFLGILDLQYLLKYEVLNLESGYKKLVDEYPNLEYVMSTNRTVSSPIKHYLKANVFYENKLYVSEEVEINVVDRIGAGDAYTAGILYGIISKNIPMEIAKFGLSNAVLKHYVAGDNYYVELADVLAYMEGNSSKINR